MAQELIYTSAPDGVRPGSSGFCTVAKTKGLSPRLMAFLESLSGYKPLYSVDSDNASQNPVSYRYTLCKKGGTFGVLSRVSSAGLDYTRRSNKIAHHIVLEPDEFIPAGPAALINRFENEGVFVHHWGGEAEPERMPLKIDKFDDPLKTPATNWKEATEDAGWAGFLAESGLNDPAKPAYVVFEPGLDVLPLIIESMRLLSAEERWKVGFNTYFTSLPQGATYTWRCCLPDAKPLRNAQRNPDTPIINLQNPGNISEETPLIAAARTGKGPVFKSTKDVAAASDKTQEDKPHHLDLQFKKEFTASSEKKKQHPAPASGHKPTHRPTSMERYDALFKKFVAGFVLLCIVGLIAFVFLKSPDNTRSEGQSNSSNAQPEEAENASAGSSKEDGTEEKSEANQEKAHSNQRPAKNGNTTSDDERKGQDESGSSETKQKNGRKETEESSEEGGGLPPKNGSQDNQDDQENDSDSNSGDAQEPEELSLEDTMWIYWRELSTDMDKSPDNKKWQSTSIEEEIPEDKQFSSVDGPYKDFLISKLEKTVERDGKERGVSLKGLKDRKENIVETNKEKYAFNTVLKRGSPSRTFTPLHLNLGWELTFEDKRLILRYKGNEKDWQIPRDTVMQAIKEKVTWLELNTTKYYTDCNQERFKKCFGEKTTVSIDKLAFDSEDHSINDFLSKAHTFEFTPKNDKQDWLLTQNYNIKCDANEKYEIKQAGNEIIFSRKSRMKELLNKINIFPLKKDMYDYPKENLASLQAKNWQEQIDKIYKREKEKLQKQIESDEWKLVFPDLGETNCSLTLKLSSSDK